MRCVRRTNLATLFFPAICAAFGVPTMALGVTSPSDIATARTLFQAAATLKSQGQLRPALEKLKTANALASTPVVLLELGRTHVLLGELLEAQEAFLAVGRLPVDPKETARSRDARAEAKHAADEVGVEVPRLKITVTGVAREQVAKLTVDEDDVSTALLGQPRLTNPGKHTVTALTTKGARQQAFVEIARGEMKDVTIAFAEQAAAPGGAAGGVPIANAAQGAPSAPGSPLPAPLAASNASGQEVPGAAGATVPQQPSPGASERPTDPLRSATDARTRAEKIAKDWAELERICKDDRIPLDDRLRPLREFIEKTPTGHPSREQAVALTFQLENPRQLNPIYVSFGVVAGLALVGNDPLAVGGQLQLGRIRWRHFQLQIVDAFVGATAKNGMVTAAGGLFGFGWKWSLSQTGGTELGFLVFPLGAGGIGKVHGEGQTYFLPTSVYVAFNTPTQVSLGLRTSPLWLGMEHDLTGAYTGPPPLLFSASIGF
jgi:hypothetical protein